MGKTANGARPALLTLPLSLTAILAVYGAVLSTVAILRQLFSDRVKVKLTVRKNREMVGHPKYKGATLVEVKITNIGHQPVTIVSFGAIGLYPHHSLAGIDSQPQLPCEIREGQFISSFWDQAGLDFSKIDYWVVCDSYDHTYKLREASIFKHWKSAFQQRKAFRKKIPTSVLASMFVEFRKGIWQTTLQKSLDIVVFVAPFVSLLIQKPKSLWAAIAPVVWAVVLIVAFHWLEATHGLWKRVSVRPVTKKIEQEPSWFRLKLAVTALLGILLLVLLSYWVGVQDARSLLTYVYLVPTPELVECKQRAFFVKAYGPRHISGLQIALKDEKSGQTSFHELADLDSDTSSESFWVTPSHPWDEQYTATIDAHDLHSIQTLIVQSHTKKLQLATAVTISGHKNFVLSCKDAQPPDPHSCSDVLKLDSDALSRLGVSNYQKADGSVTALKVKKLPSPSEMDEQSDDRHLTEFQQRALEPVVAKYPGTLLIVFYAGGTKSKAYAGEWYDFLKSKRWAASKPELVPVGNEGIIDVQLTMSDNYLQVSGESTKIMELRDALDKSGIKHAHRFTRDPNIKDGEIVLWIGPKSPKDINPDQCAGAQLKQKPGEPHTCDLISQTTGVCPFMPQ
jgi:hypothetical protein